MTEYQRIRLAAAASTADMGMTLGLFAVTDWRWYWVLLFMVAWTAFTILVMPKVIGVATR